MCAVNHSTASCEIITKLLNATLYYYDPYTAYGYDPAQKGGWTRCHSVRILQLFRELEANDGHALPAGANQEQGNTQLTLMMMGICFTGTLSQNKALDKFK